MNGVHDMGGMHGMGPIQNQKDEPVYHERWEARAFALTLAMASRLGPSSSQVRRCWISTLGFVLTGQRVSRPMEKTSKS